VSKKSSIKPEKKTAEISEEKILELIRQRQTESERDHFKQLSEKLQAKMKKHREKQESVMQQ